MSLLFNILSRLVITFLPRSKRLLISCLQSPSAVILEPKKIVCHCFHCFSIYLPWSDGTRCHDLSFLSFKPAFLFSFFTFIKRLFHSSSLSAVRVVSCICHVYCLAFMNVFHCFRKWKITMPRDTWCAADCTLKAATLPAHPSPEYVGASRVFLDRETPRKQHLCVPTTSTVKPSVNT